MNRRSYGRRLIVIIGRTGEEGRRWETTAHGGLRITFDVKKTPKSKPNTAKVTIYNLSPESREFIASGQEIQIEGGYQDGIDILHRAKITHVSSRREGNTWITTIESSDGRDTAKSVFSASFAPGATPREIFDKMLEDVRESGTATGFIDGLMDGGKGFEQGFVVNGTMEEALDKLVARQGGEWSFQNGDLQITKPGGHTNAEAWLLSPTTGLENAPEKTKTGATASCRLNGLIAPGRLIAIESDTLTGYYVAQSVDHTGDTHGDDWTTKIEARSLK